MNEYYFLTPINGGLLGKKGVILERFTVYGLDFVQVKIGKSEYIIHKNLSFFSGVINNLSGSALKSEFINLSTQGDKEKFATSIDSFYREYIQGIIIDIDFKTI